MQTIHWNGLDPSEALELSAEKAEKDFLHLDSSIMDMLVTLSHREHANPSNVAHINVKVPGKVIVAEAAGDNMYLALADSVSKIERQLRDRKRGVRG